MRIHVVGNVCVDTTFRLDHLPKAGETRNAISHADGLGGKGANQAVAASRTGLPVTLWAAIGRDANGAWVREALTGEIDHLRLTQFDLPTDRSTVAVDARGENIILSGVSCALAFNPILQTDLLNALEPGDSLVMQGNLSTEVTDACLRAARAKGVITILNVSPLASGTQPALDQVDFVLVNEGEAQALSGSLAPEAAAAGIVGLGAGAAIITLGPRGCLLLDDINAAAVQIEAPKVMVVDTSGAGDVLCGIFAGCLARGMPAETALRIAVEAAALSVTRSGTLGSCPTVTEISSLLEKSETEYL